MYSSMLFFDYDRDATGDLSTTELQTCKKELLARFRKDHSCWI